MAERRKVLVVYKKSLHRIYFLDHRRPPKGARFTAADRARLLASHESHERSLEQVRQVLAAHRVAYREVYRARRVDYAPYELVVAVGGDGTFIEASRRLTTQVILGVNSDPERSHGFFCATAADGFEQLFADYLAGRAKVRKLNRMSLELNGEDLGFQTVNEVLVAHHWPAGLSRYGLAIGERQEEQRGSGVWVATAAGSTGAIRSAGGKRMPLGSRRLQYLPREPFEPRGREYRLRGGLVPAGAPITVTSRMREGVIFVDGCHLRFPFGIGAHLVLRNSPYPLLTIQRHRPSAPSRNGEAPL